ncbi:MAG: heme-binding protein [Gammaproteobacteria bacterium]|jgi:uncharacterized protein GlcG (DUF336 family)|uniref:GlcG/HbpS family heme-binding protein n=1 Tax=Marinomonas sp. BSi20584 TaxID=1594462 RepID=UPI000C1EEE46|nr:heme-binding protein [Marinomonas sp. BSi20584]MBU1295941.1 heme-binding protein [Gammaproteobacteria bacterium]MBU1466352.1 heme-binding protein [Gammaproteobacteria bacterium]MBU2024082.1 heme-binding protein [Gammaproteobacteria bacterium]MBU2238370.1 heme-binding protein [Gammaproteobacteria bacterium]MBU2319112.1 heme-binding protein [Gammaproteobacteria bacterium]
MNSLTLVNASNIIDSALKEARKNKFAPLAVAVLDAGGHLIAFKREDDAGIARFDIAFGKAWGSLGMGFGSSELTRRSQKNPQFINTLTTISQGRMVPSPGGVLILDHEKAIIGAIGISGDIGENDEICAICGIEENGFIAVNGVIE